MDISERGDVLQVLRGEAEVTTDTKATYYDIEINGATVETKDIVRAVLERAGLGADASHQLGKVLERAIRLGAKPGTDVAREVEKIAIEAGMLRDAMTDAMSLDEPITDDDAEDAAPEALAGDAEFVRDLARAINSHSMENESDTPDFLLAQYLRATMSAFSFAVRKREEWYGGSLSTLSARIAELERELDEAQADHARAQVHINELCLEPARLRSQAAQAERERDKWEERARMTERERDEARETLSRHASAHERHITALARDRDAYCELHAKARAKLNVMTDRYRPRRQSEEKAPEDEVVLVRGVRGRVWSTCLGRHVADSATWTNVPPAPEGKGKAEE